MQIIPPDDSDEPRSIATEQLKALDPSTYAARTFVALVGLGDGTAQDVGEVAEVPRTRVYDELRDRGLIDVQYSTPRRFAPISAETAGRRFRRVFTHRVNILTGALQDIEPITRSDGQRGVWTVTGRDVITDRVVGFLEEAIEKIVYMTVGELLTDECIDALRAADDRGVTIRQAGLSPAVREEIQRNVSEPQPFESIQGWSDLPAGGGGQICPQGEF